MPQQIDWSIGSWSNPERSVTTMRHLSLAMMIVALMAVTVVANDTPALPDSLLIETGQFVVVDEEGEQEVLGPYFLKVVGSEAFVNGVRIYPTLGDTKMQQPDSVNIKDQLDDQAYSLFQQLVDAEPGRDKKEITQQVADAVYGQHPDIYEWVKVLDNGSIQVKERDFPIPKLKVFQARTSPTRTDEAMAKSRMALLARLLQQGRRVYYQDGLIVTEKATEQPSNSSN
ncbi:MAG: hypothetical protein ABIB97_06125 [Patescibacteria group bacterium]